MEIGGSANNQARPSARASWRALDSQARRTAGEALHLLLAALALVCAFALRFEFSIPHFYAVMLIQALPWLLLVKFTVFRAFSLRDLSWRYLGFEDLVRILQANAIASVATTLVLRWALGPPFPRSIYVLDLLLCIAFLTLAKTVARSSFDGRWLARGTPASDPHRRVLIYGAGEAGRRVLAEARTHPELRTQVVGFIDDDPNKRHLHIAGLRVFGNRGDLPAIVRRHSVDQVWLALATASGAEIAAILESCHAVKVAAKRIPPLSELIQSKVFLDQLRPVRIEDLLGRPPVQLDHADVREQLAGQVVLVTGAGGSIGSELCRQIARAQPLALIGLDHSENALYQIEMELREQFPGVPFYPEIASIQNPRRMREIFLAHAPAIVYHAAAYKHVPMMETQAFEAIENNVFGTRNIAQAAQISGVRTFVLISSDKAVRPANVMGATKKLAELVCMGIENTASDSTRFLAVRFGNVMGSSGSVIPLFQRQISSGGPLTVTHPEMQRYFMTIPEAVQLVLQAAALGSGGEIFVLEMGEPVKILDLARKMILLSGLRLDEDVQIQFSGPRAGEKLFEELHTSEEETGRTPHPKIRVLRGPYSFPNGSRATAEILRRQLEALQGEVTSRDFGATLTLLKEMVPEYTPSGVVLSRALQESSSTNVASV